MSHDRDCYQQPNRFFDRQQALQALRDLSFSFAAMADRFEQGSYEREMALNAARGVRFRIDYLHASFVRLLDKTAATETKS